MKLTHKNGTYLKYRYHRLAMHSLKLRLSHLILSYGYYTIGSANAEPFSSVDIMLYLYLNPHHY